MPDFRRLPPFLRVVTVVGYLVPISALILFLILSAASFTANGWSFPLMSANGARVLVIVINLIFLRGICYSVVTTYAKRFRPLDKRRLELDSWQSQARALALMGTLPLCAIALAAVLSPTQDAFGLAFGVSILAGMVLLGATLALASD